MGEFAHLLSDSGFARP